MYKALQHIGLRVPDVYTHLTYRDASALVTHAITQVHELAECDRGRHAAILLDMAVVLLQTGFTHTDLHAGNVLLDYAFRPVLIDVYEVRPLTRIKPRHIFGLFSQVESSFGLTRQDLASALARIPGQGDLTYLIDRIKSQAATMHAQRVRRWIRRSLREGSFSRQVDSGGYTAWVNRRYPLAAIRVI